MAFSKIKFIRNVCRTIDLINYWTGTMGSYVIFLMVLMMTYEVLARYLFNAPTIWSAEMSQYGLCFISMLGGGYAILMDEHVRVDILYQRFSVRRQAVLELCTWWLVLVFSFVLVWKGGEMAVSAFLKGEKSMGFINFPMYPSLALIPIGACLMLLQAVARITRNVLTLVTEVDENKSAISRLHKTEG